MILVACWGGNVRSVHAAFILKHILHYKDVVTIGVGTTEAPLLNTLCSMSDKILAVGDQTIYDGIPTQFKDKTLWLNVGIDKWGWRGFRDLEDTVGQMLIDNGFSQQS